MAIAQNRLSSRLVAGGGYGWVSHTLKAVWHCRQQAGVAIYSNSGSGDVDFSEHYDFVASGSTCTTSALADGTWRFAARRRNELYEEKNVSQWVEIIVSSGSDVQEPNAPYALSATAVAGGAIALKCAYDPVGQNVAPVYINFYYDSGSGTVDYATPLHQVAISIDDNAMPETIEWTSSALTDGTTYRFGVGAESADGTIVLSDDTVTATADSQDPSDIDPDSIQVTKVYSPDA